MDSTLQGSPGGEITEAQASWLDARLNEKPTQPTMIFMHNPPIKCGVLETDVDGFIGKKLLGPVFSKHHHVEKIICGHIRVPINTSWNDTAISTAPSMGMQLVLDLTLKGESEFVLEATKGAHIRLRHLCGPAAQRTTNSKQQHPGTSSKTVRRPFDTLANNLHT